MSTFVDTGTLLDQGNITPRQLQWLVEKGRVARPLKRSGANAYTPEQAFIVFAYGYIRNKDISNRCVNNVIHELKTLLSQRSLQTLAGLNLVFDEQGEHVWVLSDSEVVRAAVRHPGSVYILPLNPLLAPLLPVARRKP